MVRQEGRIAESDGTEEKQAEGIRDRRGVRAEQPPGEAGTGIWACRRGVHEAYAGQHRLTY